LDEETLKEISEMTGAQYFRAIDTDRLEEIYTELDKLEPIEYEEENYRPTTLLYYYPLGLALLLTILLSLVISSVSVFRMITNNKNPNVE
jgi:Ca-activated chloride channel family protein